MVFKPFTNLARQSISKHLVNGYAQSVVAASQSSYASTTLPIHRLNSNAPAKLHNVFGGAHSGRTAPGKDSGGDGLNSSYAVQSATVEDKDEKKYLFSGKILWSKAQHQQQQQALLGAPQPMSENPKERRGSVGSVGEVEVKEALVEAEEAIEEAVEEKLVEEEEEGSLVADAAAQITEQYNAQFAMLREQGRYQEVVAVFRHMVAEGIRPNTVSYNFYLSAIVGLRPRHVAQVLDVYRDMLRERLIPSTSTYSILLDFLATRAMRNFGVVRDIERDAKRFGVELQSKKVLAAELKAEGALDSALALFYAATDVRTERKFPKEIYETLVRACSKYGKDDDMIKITVQMEAHALEPTPDIVRSMIKCFGRTGDVRCAVQAYNSWTELDYTKDEGLMDERYHIYATLIRAYMDGGDPVGALSFLERVVEVNQDASRIEWLTQAVIRGLVDEGEVASAKIWAAKLSVRLTNSMWLAKLLEKVADKGELDFTRALYNTLTLSHPFVNTHQLLAIPNTNNNSQMDVDEAAVANSQLDELRHSLANCQIAALALCLRDNNLVLARDLWLDLNNPLTSNGPDMVSAIGYVSALFENNASNEALVVLKQFSDFFMERYMPDENTQITPQFAEEKRQGLQECYEYLLVQLTHKNLINPSIAMDMAGFALKLCGGLSAAGSRNIMSNFDTTRIQGLSREQLSLLIPFQIASLHGKVEGVQTLETDELNLFKAIVHQAIHWGFPLGSSEVNVINAALPLIAAYDMETVAVWTNHFQQMVLFDTQAMAQSLPAVAPFATETTVSSGQNTERASTLEGSPTMVNTEVESTAVDSDFNPYWAKTDARTSDAIEMSLERNKYHKIADFRRMYRATRRQGRHIRLNTVARLITAVAKTNSYEDFIDELYRNATVDTPLMLDVPFSKNAWIEVMDTMIAALLNLGRREKAAGYHTELTKIGAAPSANTFGLYIVSLRTSKTHDEATEAMEVFNRAIEEGVAPTSFLYNAVVGKLAKARRVDDCLYYFADMRARGVKATSVTYGTMINALTRVGDETFAEELFREMEACANYRPRPAPYNSMMQFFITTKRDRSKVLAYYERMKAMSIQPTSHTFKLLVEAYAILDTPDIAAAEKVLDTIREHGQHVETSHHAALIMAKGNTLHDVPAALAHFRGVLDANQVRPDTTLFQALLEVLVANHRVQETPAWISDMNKRNIAMTPYIANTLIHGWAAKKNIAMCEKIYSSATRREPSTYEAMVRAYLAVENRIGAKKVADEMLTRGYPHAVVARVLDLVRGVDNKL